MKKNKKTGFILVFALTALILYFALKDNFSQKVTYLLSFNPKWLLVAFSLILSYWFLKGLVLYYCISKIDTKYTQAQGIHLMMTTQFFHAITPYAAGGQPWQIYKLSKDGLTLGQSTNVVIQDFIAYQVALVLLGGLAIVSNFIFHILPSNDFLGKLTIAGFTFNVLVIVFLFFLAFNKKWNKKIIDGVIKFLSKLKIIKDKEKLFEKSEEFIQNFHESAIILFNSKFNMVRIIFLNFMALIGQYLIPFTLMMGLGIYVNPLVVIVTSAYVMLIGSMVPIPGGTGGLEYSFMSFFKNFIPSSKLSIIMIVWRTVTYYFGILIGGIVLNIRKEEK